MKMLLNSLNSFYGYARFYLSLKEFLRNIISEEEAKKIITQRLNNREDNFLKLIKNGIFLNKASPYLKLFNFFKISYNDLEKMVAKGGLEFTLNLLKEEGVYLTTEEFKGKKPVKRGNFEFKFEESDFDNRLLSAYYYIKTGGTRSLGTRTLLDLEYIAAKAAYYPLIFSIHNLVDCKIGLWAPGPPLGAGILPLFHFAKAGKEVLKWFSPTKLDMKRKIGLKLINELAKEIGTKLPYPEYASLKDISKVVKWIIFAKAAHKSILFLCYVSGAVRICEFAKINNLDISGIKFWVFGEPLTKVRHDIIKSCGCDILPLYSFIELGSVGAGCIERISPEEVHFFKDSLALIQHQKTIPAVDGKAGAFLFSSILSSAPKVLLNVENGDYGIVEDRPCGCALGKLGLKTHIRNIQSFEKLNVEGMTFYIFDFIPILEEVLPRRFGGSLLDYQISEELDNDSIRLNLIISPDVGIIDEQEVKSTILSELGERSHLGKYMVEILRQAGALKIKREYPAITKAGKIYPLAVK